MESPNYALYYPYIEFQDYEWLWSASLLWDKIYKIVPESYTPDEPRNVKILQESGDIGIPISPLQYAKDIADEFIDKLQSPRWRHASALHFDKPDNFEEYARLHHEKVDVQLRKMIISKGIGENSGDWIGVPTDFEALYMTYLANTIAEKNNLNLVSDSTAAWTGSTFFNYDGYLEDFPFNEFEQHLASIIIRDFVPENITSILPEDLLRFRERRKDERRRFVNSIKNAAKKISECEDSKIVLDLVEDLKKDINASVKDYKRSTDILHVVGWTGLKSLSFPVLTEVIGKVVSLQSASITILSEVGLGMGVLVGLSELYQKKKKLSKESEFSYLLHLSRNWTKNHYQGDYHYMLSRQIEEFIND